MSIEKICEKVGNIIIIRCYIIIEKKTRREAVGFPFRIDERKSVGLLLKSRLQQDR